MSDEPPEYRLSPKAQRDLEEIWLYTLTEWGIKQAHRYTDKLAVAFDALAAKPKIANRCDHIRIGYRRLKVERHIIYFRVVDHGIVVTRILHERMLSARHLGLDEEQ